MSDGLSNSRYINIELVKIEQVCNDLQSSNEQYAKNIIIIERIEQKIKAFKKLREKIIQENNEFIKEELKKK
jgi:hypothetical protein